MRSRRLMYRKLLACDAPRIAELAGRWEIASMTARIPYPYSAAMAEQWIAGLSEDDFVRAVLLDGEIIGAVGYFASKDNVAEIGYWIGQAWWGNGYATEAAAALVRHCFWKVRFGRLTCCHFADNEASRRVIEKLGFAPTNPCRAYCEARKRDVEIVRYELKRPALALFWRPAA